MTKELQDLWIKVYVACMRGESSSLRIRASFLSSEAVREFKLAEKSGVFEINEQKREMTNGTSQT